MRMLIILIFILLLTSCSSLFTEKDEDPCENKAMWVTCKVVQKRDFPEAFYHRYDSGR